MFFDTHTHLDDDKFDDDRDSVISSLRDFNVTRIMNVSCDLETAEKTIALCDNYDFIYGAVGVHPHNAEEVPDDYLDTLRKMSKHDKIKAIGEIGLDYYYDFSPRDVQKKIFTEQLHLARELNLPVIIHDRDAHEDCLNILRDFTDLKVVYHCYSGSLEYAKILISLGFYLSFTGSLTFKNAKAGPEVVSHIPIERMFIETDCPYLAPVPNRGKRNFPGFVPLVAEKIAEIRNIPVEDVAKITFENANQFFNVK
ncbi:MAG: TatD family hydrolase [Clostridia bacterium]|nr:TatD family hydrolase [Clostridia bacterium]